MSMTISDYRLQVRTLIRDIAGLGATPNTSLFWFQDSEIDQFTQSAVQIYSRYRSRRKPYTLSLVANTNQYTLPSDWIKPDMQSFSQATAPSDVNLMEFSSFVLPSINPSGSLPDLVFDWYNSDQYVLVNPTPMANYTINFAYYTYHTVDTNGSTIPVNDSYAVVLAAASRALDALAVDRGTKMQKYKIGKGLQIDNQKVAEHLQAESSNLWSRFEQMIVKRPYGVMG